MKILISGASGVLGRQLSAYLSTAGHEVISLVRRPSKESKEIFWEPASGELNFPEDFNPDVVINLSGANVGKIPWTKSYKKTILDSRLDTTRLLVARLLELENPPKVYISASGLGFYGDGGEREFTTEDSVGEGFLASVCQQWEAASEDLDKSRIRRVLMRMGPVLTTRGGMLERLAMPSKLGLGAVLGDGKEWLSWIGLDDFLGAVEHIIHDEGIQGPINMTAPNPVRMEAFQDTLSSVLSRPRFLRAPSMLVKFFGGEAIEAMAMTSTRALPNTLMYQGFKFNYPELEDQLRHE